MTSEDRERSTEEWPPDHRSEVKTHLMLEPNSVEKHLKVSFSTIFGDSVENVITQGHTLKSRSSYFT